MDIVNMSLNGEKIFTLSDALCTALDKFLDVNKMTLEEVLIAICHFKHKTVSSDHLPAEILTALDVVAKSISQIKADDVKKAHGAANNTLVDDFYLDSLSVPSKHLH